MRIVLSIFVATTLLLGLTACGGKDKEEAQGAPAPAAANAGRAATVTTVALRPLSGGVTASGLLVSREEAAVGAELAGYRVSRVLVEEGARVSRGQALAELDPTLLEAQIAQQQAVLTQRQAEARQSQAEADRVRGLEKEGILSLEQIEQRRATATTARAAVAAQAAAVRDLQTRRERLVIRAPVAGLVLERTLRPGDISAPGANPPYFRMARDSLVELAAQVSEADLAAIRPGQPVDVSLPNGASVSGVVRLVSPRVDPQTKLGEVRVAMPVRADLRPGGFGRASFGGAARVALTVPEAAVRYDADGASVMVVEGDNRVRRTAVRTGRRGAGYTELLEGPPAGARVVAAAGAFLQTGDRIRPIAERAPGPAAAAAAPAAGT